MQLLDFERVDDTRFIKDAREITAKFSLEKMPPDDIMMKGGELYAIYNYDLKRWVTGADAYRYLIQTTDAALAKCAKMHTDLGERVIVKWMWDSDSGTMDRFLKFAKKHLPANCFHQLDDSLTFEGQETSREDYSSKCLPYALSKGECPAWEELTSVLLNKENKAKVEWAIGAIGTGDSKHIQKFFVFYGEAGSGKSTILNIIQELFKGYWVTFVSKDIGSANKDFALEAFKNGPLVAIEHDGNLSKIEDNSKLNSLVSHETVELNVKNEKKYPMVSHAFIFIGTNEVVKITNTRSGLTRRLIDIRSSGKKIPTARYNQLMNQIPFELGQIMNHCIEVYKKMGEHYYDAYIPTEMIAATNDFYDFIEHNYDKYVKADMVTLSEAWKSYLEYCEFANAYKMSQRIFRTELRNYFTSYKDSATIDGKRISSVYMGFRADRFKSKTPELDEDEKVPDIPSWLDFGDNRSQFDIDFYDWMAQVEVDYGKGGQPEKAWAKVTTRVCDIDTHSVHYVLPPANFPIVMIDFDLKGENGEKDLQKNIEAASKFPKTYGEISKSGSGIHLYYIWNGCPLSELSSLYSEGIEVKVFTGNSAIRRKLTLCNKERITTLSSGLPKKGVKKTVNWEGIKNEKMLRSMIRKNLEKGYHSDTSSSINYIKSLLDEAYESGLPYNVTDMRQDILLFAINSTNQSERCIAAVGQMHFASDDNEDAPEKKQITAKSGDEMLVIDIEIYKPDKKGDNPGLFLICWKILGSDLTPSNVTAMINPKPYEIQELLDKFLLMGFNILEYDCQMIWAASRGDNNEQLYDLSHAMINLNQNDVKSWEAKKMVGCDVYEYTKAAGEGRGLKKWEIMLSDLSSRTDEELASQGYKQNQIKAISAFRGNAMHKEMDIPWDRPAPKEKWDEIVKYCKNDVLATEAVFLFTQNYWKARLFMVDLVHALHGDRVPAYPRDTANTLSKKTIFAGEKNPQKEFNYRDLSQPVGYERYQEYVEKFGEDYNFRVWNDKGLPEYRDYIPGEILPDGWSILPFFPGYVFDRFAPKGKKSFFMDDYGGEGGRTFSLKGIWTNVYDGDIASQYPSSIIAEVLFGKRYTKIFKELVLARIAVKHKDFEKAGSYLNGALIPYLNNESAGDLAQALKIIINSIYGLTSASFDNEFRDQRNIDNIVAKRGNLFMMVLKDQIEKMGYQVVHIKTDSIKVANADKKVQDFIVKFGKEYGYSFETEAEFTKFALLNDAAYVGKLKDGSWSFKADEFKPEIIRKTLFTHKPVNFEDYCMTFSTKDALYLDLNEGLEDVSAKEKRLKYLSGKYSKGEVPKAFSSLEEVEAEMKMLGEDIDKGHNLKFVGKVGQFTPVMDGTGGGYLYRVADGKRYSVGGAKGFRWLESDTVRNSGFEDRVDLEYFRKLVDEAKDDISSLPGANFEWFVADDDYMNAPEVYIPEGTNEEVPFK